jgi:hypothetical protein
LPHLSVWNPELSAELRSIFNASKYISDRSTKSFLPTSFEHHSSLFSPSIDLSKEHPKRRVPTFSKAKSKDKRKKPTA